MDFVEDDVESCRRELLRNDPVDFDSDVCSGPSTEVADFADFADEVEKRLCCEVLSIAFNVSEWCIDSPILMGLEGKISTLEP